MGLGYRVPNEGGLLRLLVLVCSDGGRLASGAIAAAFRGLAPVNRHTEGPNGYEGA